MKKNGIYTVLAVLFLIFPGPGPGNAGEISFVYENWVPLDYFDDSGRECGLLVDIAKEVFEKELGLNLVCIQRPWKRAQIEVKKGAADFMVTVATPARKTYAIAGKHPFYTIPLYVYTYAGHRQMADIHRIRSARDIRKLDLRPVTNLGNGWHKDNIDDMGIHTHYVGTDKNVLLFLANKRADIMIDGLVTTNYLIRQMGLSQKIVLTRSLFSQVDLHLLLSRKSRFSSWMPNIDKAFERLEKSGRIASIISRYPGCDS